MKITVMGACRKYSLLLLFVVKLILRVTFSCLAMTAKFLYQQKFPELRYVHGCIVCFRNANIFPVAMSMCIPGIRLLAAKHK